MDPLLQRSGADVLRAAQPAHILGCPQQGVALWTSPPLFVFCSYVYCVYMRPQITPRQCRKPARFPNAIREYRLKAGLTQKRLAELVGRARSIISIWERGRRLPNLPDTFRLARALDTLAEGLYTSLYLPNRRKEEPSDSKLP
jgi:DNA-binding XRE family transcriptional regulator